MLLTSQKCGGSNAFNISVLKICNVLAYFWMTSLSYSECVNSCIFSLFPWSYIVFMHFFVFIKNLLKVSGNILLNIAITSVFIS